MVAAVFYINSWLGTEEHYFEGENASNLLDQFKKVQDLDCLSRMGCVQGTKKDAKELEKLDVLLDKYYSGNLTMADLKEFTLEISIGSIGVKAIAETEEELEQLASYIA